LDVVDELSKFQKFEDRPIEVKVLPVNLELAKLFTQLGGLNGKVPLGMTKEVDLPSGHEGSIELTNQYAKLARTSIPTKVDTSIGEVNMIGSSHIVNGNDKSTG
jgi:hypothetical protein